MVLPSTPGQGYASIAWAPNITDNIDPHPALHAVVSVPPGFESLLLHFPVGQYVLTLAVEDAS